MTIHSSLLDKEVNFRISCALIKLPVWQNSVSILLVSPMLWCFQELPQAQKETNVQLLHCPILKLQITFNNMRERDLWKKYLQMTWSVPIVWRDKFWDEKNKKDSYLCLAGNKFNWIPNELKVTMKEKNWNSLDFRPTNSQICATLIKTKGFHLKYKK